MMKQLGFIAIPAVLLLVTGCSSTPSSDYVWVKDYELMQQVETASRSSSMTNQVHWVNPPMKRIPREEWEQRHKQQL